MKGYLLLMLLTTIPMFSQENNPKQDVLEVSLQFAKGNAEFREVYFKEHEEAFARLAREGQAPKALYIGCSDSRVIPDIITNARPGELFVIRSAGNFVPTYNPNIQWDGIAATVEYAIEVLGIKEIIVCGHSQCGAIQALFQESPPGTLQTIKKWLQFGEQAKQMTLLSVPENVSPDQRFKVAAHLSVVFQLQHLLSYPYIKQKVEEQRIFLHGWYFEIETGELSYYDPSAARFFPMRTLLKN